MIIACPVPEKEIFGHGIRLQGMSTVSTMGLFADLFR